MEMVVHEVLNIVAPYGLTHLWRSFGDHPPDRPPAT